MKRTCLRCGHRNANANGSADEACPSCGALYRKVEAFVNEHGVLALKKRGAAHAASHQDVAMDKAPEPAASQSKDKPATTPIYLRPWFYILAAFLLGPIISAFAGLNSGVVAMGPFVIAILFAALNAYRKTPAPASKKVQAIVHNGIYACRSCGSRFNEPKMRGNGWIELVLYVFVFIVGGVIYSIWRRSGQNKECPQCGSRAFSLASESGLAQAALDDAVRVPCPECHELVLPGARKCKHCGSAITTAA